MAGINWEAAKRQGFGVELEMSEISRENAARTIASYFGTERTVRKATGHAASYDGWICTDRKGRIWTVMSDCSIQDPTGRSRENGKVGAEMVTPILHYDDMEDLQEICRQLRHKGAQSDPRHGCGVHIHITSDTQSAQTLRNLTNLVAAHEDILAKSLSISDARLGRWCRRVDRFFLERINSRKPQTMEQIELLWYNGNIDHSHYNRTRYHLLNLHSHFTGKGIEFRAFNFDNRVNGHGGIHAGMLKSWIQLSLALCEKALESRSCSPAKVQMENEKYSMRTWLLRLGFIGDEFATARDILVRRLDGDAAFRHGRRAA